MDKINLGEGISIMIDVRSYLERYDCWERARWSEDRLSCLSPFRPDRHPSFFVNFNNRWSGTWGDSATGETGNFIALVSQLVDVSYEDAREMLIEEFYTKPYEIPDISIRLSTDDVSDHFEITPNYSDYLNSRGIGEDSQKAYQTSQEEDSVTFPYIDGSQVCRATKHRQISKKNFWYEYGNNRINDLLYGYHLIYKLKPSTVVICEAEIDAMTAFEMGYVGVSLGSAHCSEDQIELLMKTGIQNFIIATDNDRAGNLCANELEEHLSKGVANVYRYKLPANGDLNEYWQKHYKRPLVKHVSKGTTLSTKVWFRGI